MSVITFMIFPEFDDIMLTLIKRKYFINNNLYKKPEMIYVNFLEKHGIILRDGNEGLISISELESHKIYPDFSKINIINEIRRANNYNNKYYINMLKSCYKAEKIVIKKPKKLKEMEQILFEKIQEKNSYIKEVKIKIRKNNNVNSHSITINSYYEI